MEAVDDFSQAECLGKNDALLDLALSRIERNAGRSGIPAEDVYVMLGVTEADLEDFDEIVEFE